MQFRQPLRPGGRYNGARFFQLRALNGKSKTCALLMIYNLSLQTAGIIAGAFLVVVTLPSLIKPDLAALAQKFPRSRVAGFVLLTIDLAWTMWLLATVEMGEFSAFRKPLLIAAPIGYILVIRFVDEFLAVRALGIFCLLSAEPLLEAAFLRYEMSRLLVTVFAYLLIVAGLFWTAMPYVLRDQINWGARNALRWRFLHGLALCYGTAILSYAFTRY